MNLGQHQKALLTWFADTWLADGPVACYLAGFAGVGKSTLAREVAARAAEAGDLRVIEVEVPPAGRPAGGLIEQIGDLIQPPDAPIMANQAEILEALEKCLVNEQVLLVVEEAQRLLAPDRTVGRPLWPLLERLSRKVRPAGRILFVGTTAPEDLSWQEQFAFKVLGALDPDEGERLLGGLLADAMVQTDGEDLHRVSVWLGGNPRALKTIGVLMRYEPLSTLILEVPEDLDPRVTPVLAPELVDALERQFTERTLRRLRPEAHGLLGALSVHRTGFERLAIDLAAGRGETLPLITELISNFLMERDRNWYRITPVARALALAELRRDPAATRTAHAAAGRYHARHFTGVQVAGSRLARPYAEARHHLVAAGDRERLEQISVGFSAHIFAKYSSTSEIPWDDAGVAETAAELAAVLDRPRNWGIHYFYSRVLAARDAPGDAEIMLRQCDFGLQLRPEFAPLWLRKLAVLRQLDRMDEAVACLRAALDVVPASKSLFSLYQAGIELHSRRGAPDAAVALLAEGVHRVQPSQGLFSLYRAGIELHSRRGDFDAAVDLLSEGIRRVSPSQGLFSLYRAGIELHTRRGDVEAAVAMLEEGIRRVPPSQNLFSLYQAGIEFYTRQRDLRAVGELALRGIQADPPINSRHKIAESLLYVLFGCVSTGEQEHAAHSWWDRADVALREDREQRLSQVLRLAADERWSEAYQASASWRQAHGSYAPLLGQEIFSALAAGNVQGALAAAAAVELTAMKTTARGRPMAWLLALCYYTAGSHADAWRLLADYWDVRPGTGPAIDTLMDIWGAQDGDFGARPSFFFPVVPAGLTGSEEGPQGGPRGGGQGGSPGGSRTAKALGAQPKTPSPAPSSGSSGGPAGIAPIASQRKEPWPMDPLPGKATILFLAANPAGSGRLALDREYRDVEQALRSAGLRDQVQLQSAWAVRVRDLQTALLRYKPTIVHFAGHGLHTEGIVLEDTATAVTGAALARLLDAVAKQVRLVVLNACWSAEQAAEIVAVSGCVVGMRRPVADEAAIEFAQSLYETLAYGLCLQNAFDAGIARLAILGMSDGPAPGDGSGHSANPQLLVAEGVDAGLLRLVGDDDDA